MQKQIVDDFNTSLQLIPSLAASWPLATKEDGEWGSGPSAPRVLVATHQKLAMLDCFGADSYQLKRLAFVGVDEAHHLDAAQNKVTANIQDICARAMIPK